MKLSHVSVTIMVAPANETDASQPSHASIDTTFSSKTQAAHNKKKKNHEKMMFDFSFTYDPAPFTDIHIDHIAKHTPTHPGLYYRKPASSQSLSMEAQTTSRKKNKYAHQIKSVKPQIIHKSIPEPLPSKKPSINPNKTKTTIRLPTNNAIPHANNDNQIKHPYYKKHYTIETNTITEISFNNNNFISRCPVPPLPTSIRNLLDESDIIILGMNNNVEFSLVEIPIRLVNRKIAILSNHILNIHPDFSKSFHNTYKPVYRNRKCFFIKRNTKPIVSNFPYHLNTYTDRSNTVNEITFKADATYDSSTKPLPTTIFHAIINSDIIVLEYNNKIGLIREQLNRNEEHTTLTILTYFAYFHNQSFTKYFNRIFECTNTKNIFRKRKHQHNAPQYALMAAVAPQRIEPVVTRSVSQHLRDNPDHPENNTDTEHETEEQSEAQPEQQRAFSPANSIHTNEPHEHFSNPDFSVTANNPTTSPPSYHETFPDDDNNNQDTTDDQQQRDSSYNNNDPSPYDEFIDFETADFRKQPPQPIFHPFNLYTLHQYADIIASKYYDIKGNKTPTPQHLSYIITELLRIAKHNLAYKNKEYGPDNQEFTKCINDMLEIIENKVEEHFYKMPYYNFTNYVIDDFHERLHQIKQENNPPPATDNRKPEAVPSKPKSPTPPKPDPIMEYLKQKYENNATPTLKQPPPAYAPPLARDSQPSSDATNNNTPTTKSHPTQENIPIQRISHLNITQQQNRHLNHNQNKHTPRLNPPNKPTAIFTSIPNAPTKPNAIVTPSPTAPTIITNTDVSPPTTTITELTTNLIRTAKHMSMKQLELHSDPTLRRERFNNWSLQLNVVLGSFEQTKNMLANAPLVHRLEPNADRCVYQLILAKSGNQVLNFITSCNHSSGYQAYIDLQRQCAQINEQLKRNAEQKLILLAWTDNETATSFLHRFRKELTRCQHLGVFKSECERVDLFLSLTRNITPTSPYQTRLELLHSYRDARRDTANELMLADIETSLYAIDEEIKHNQPTNRRNYNEESALSTAQQRPTNTSPNKTCTYCHKPGHGAFECRKRLQNNSSSPPSYRNTNNN